MNTKSWGWMGAMSLLFAVLGTAHAADAGDAGPAPPNDSKLEEIVVTGMRASLEKSLDVKKNAPVVLDSINATELGRFPDDDVADSLSHLPGVTLTRTTGGEGARVNVRGFGPQYNIVTLNNRILATDDDGRDLAFDVLPSEVISGADVLKSAQASAIEGSIGGTVNLRTASPFDNPGLHAGAHAETNYNAMSELHGSKYSAFVSDTNDDRTLGFLLGLVHSSTNIRTDSLNAYTQAYSPSDSSLPTSYPFNGGPNAVPINVSPCCITFGSVYDDKKRDAISGSLEWRPSDTLKVVGDALFTRLRDPQIGYNQSYYWQYGTDQFGNPAWSNATVQNGLVTGVTADTFQPEMVNNTENRNVDTSMIGFNVSWKPTDRLSFTGDLYQSVAKRPEGGTDTFVTAGLVTNQPYAQDLLIMQDVPNSLPNLNVLVPPSQLGLSSCPSGTAGSMAGYCSYSSLMNSGFLNNNNYWSTHYVGMNGYSVHDQVTGFTLDGSYDLRAGIFDRLLFGVGETDRDKSRTDSSNDWTNGSGQYGTLYQTAGCPIQCNPYSFGSQGFNVISMVSPPHFMQGAGGSFPTTLPQLNSAALFAFLQSLDGKGNPQNCLDYPACTMPGAPFSFASTLPQPNPYNSYAVTEKTTTFYVESELTGNNWSGNVGLRVVHTATSANTAVAVPTSLWTPTTVGATQTWTVIYGTSQPIGANGSYTLALPSLNLNYWAVPDRLQLRFAAAETMSRPNLNQLAPTSYNNAINGLGQLYYTGTAGLKPIKADQADLSVEWYYQPHSALTGALFEKRLKDDIYTQDTGSVDLGTQQCVGGPPGTGTCSPFPWLVQAPANGAKSIYTGIELTWQHFMDNGFGIHMQYTYTQSRGYDQNGIFAGPINAVPPTTIGISLIYDKGPLAADINWDHASRFAFESAESTEVPGWPAISDPFAWVTASVHYKFAKGFEVYLEGKNLTNSVARSYLNGNPLLPWAPGQLTGESISGTGVGYSSYGRTFVAGLAYRF
jgi:iron complex outermembrane recepter protein